MHFLIASLILSILSFQANTQYKKVIHNYNPEAKCLDGSPATLYLHEGGDPTKILIFFLGGGTCGESTLDQTLESCYQRSKTLLGSSNEEFWPKVIPGGIIPDFLLKGYLSVDPSDSAFAGWTKFFLIYCDGAIHQGYSKDPIKYKDAQLYFRGSTISRSHIGWINQQYNLKKADKILLTGMSAGGIAVNLWSNYMKDLVGDSSKVYSVSDSSFIINFKTITGDPYVQNQIKNVFKVANIDELTPLTECNQKYTDEEWKCIFLEHTYPFINGRFMIVNSEYDAYAIPEIMKIQCLTDGMSGKTLSLCDDESKQYIEAYRSVYREKLTAFVNFNSQLSVWSIACSQHVYACLQDFYDSSYQKIPTQQGKTVRKIVEDFVLNNQKNVLMETKGWPSNSGCAY